MLVRLSIVAALGSLLLASSAFAAPSADDFLPVAQGGSERVEKPADVKKENGTIQGATAQDSVNAAIEDMGGAPGCRMVKFSSGAGFVASGTATYLEMDNPVATRISKRNAYVSAYLKAKKELAQTLGGLNNESKERVRESLLTADLPKETLANLKNQTDESVKQSVSMMLRGFVIYTVKDDTKQRQVKVVIATSPKTRTQGEYLSPNAISASSIKAGMEQVIREVQAGVIPPVGNRIIMVPATHETAFIGFGSAVVRANANGTAQAKLNLAALQQAKMRASASLCGVLKGDQTAWEGTMTESTKEEFKQFETSDSGDPLKDAESASKLDKERQSFVATMKQTDVYRSATEGVIPAGVNTKTWFSEDKGWAYAMSVYLPSASAEAQKAAEEMRNGVAATAAVAAPGVPTEGNGIHDQTNVQRPSSQVKEGANGQVSDDKNL